MIIGSWFLCYILYVGRAEKLSAGSLDGVIVVEAAGHVAGPFAGMLLGDLGAEVIKIEKPGSGDPHRGRSHGQRKGPSFRALNRNKKSVALDLAEREGREAFDAIVASADVLIDNFRPRTRLAMRLTCSELEVRFRKLIHCSISGFGRVGPYIERPAFDTIAQALSGAMSLTTDFEDPKALGISLADHGAGLYAAIGVLAALHARDRTGAGQHVEASLLRTNLSFIESHIADFLNGGRDVADDHREYFARGRIFILTAKDNQPLVVHMSGHQSAWRRLLDTCGLGDVADEVQYSDSQSRWGSHNTIQDQLQRQIRSHDREYWLTALTDAGIACAPIYRLGEVLGDPQVACLNVPFSVDEGQGVATQLIGPGLEMDGTPCSAPGRAPDLGENTEEILARFRVEIQ